jgi:hypothetical protein
MADNPQISPATIEAMRLRFGLDRPWWVQYLLYLKNVFLHLDFGESFSRHQPVFQVLGTGLSNTLVLASAAAVVTWGLAIPLGVLAGGAAVRMGRQGLVLRRVPVAERARGAERAAAAVVRGENRLVPDRRHARPGLRPVHSAPAHGRSRAPSGAARRWSWAWCHWRAACARCARICWTSCGSTT